MTDLDTTHLDPIDEQLNASPFTVDEVLALAELPERTARICLKANLQAEYDRLKAELSTLVTATGEVIDQVETAAGEKSPASRALEINDRMHELRREMGQYMWHVTFRAMNSDDWASFVKRHRPKDGPKVDYSDYYNRLVCETAVEPTISMEQILKLRKTLAPASIEHLIVTAHEACSAGGLDIPKLPVSSRSLAGASSED